MTRTTLTLPDDLAQALRREALRRSVSTSTVAGDALKTHLGLTSGGPGEPLATLVHGGQGSSASDIEEQLAREWDDYAGRR